MITTESVNISPEQADAWLQDHYQRLDKGEFKKRFLSDGVIKRYAGDMKSGSWLLCPQPIVFDVSGNLVDGQHRLEAVKMSKVTVPMMVSRGWPAQQNGDMSTIDVVDRGRSRTVAQQMQLHGWTSASNYCACVSTAAHIAWNGRFYATTYAGTHFVLDKLNLKKSIDRILSKSSNTRDFKGRLVGALAYYHTVRPMKAEQFADDLFNFTAEKGSAVQAYLKWHKNNTKSRHEQYVTAISVCLRAWDASQPLSYVRLNDEAVKWLADLNPKLRDNIRSVVSSK